MALAIVGLSMARSSSSWAAVSVAGIIGDCRPTANREQTWPALCASMLAMERRNVQLAFVGEGNADEDTNLEDLVEGDEAIDIEVISGKVMLVVPAGTPDADIFD